MNSAVNIILYIAIQFFLYSREDIGIRKATNLLEVNRPYIGHIDQDMYYYYYVRLSQKDILYILYQYSLHCTCTYIFIQPFFMYGTCI